MKYPAFFILIFAVVQTPMFSSAQSHGPYQHRAAQNVPHQIQGLHAHNATVPSGIYQASSHPVTTVMPEPQPPASYLLARLEQLEAEVQSLTAGENPLTISNDVLSPRRRAGFYVGGGLVFARPNFKEAFQYSQTNVATGQQTLIPFDYDFEETPRAWFGFKNERGVGIRADYWSFDGAGQSSFDVADGFNIFGAHAVTIIFPANIFAAVPGDALATQNSLATEIFNLYGTMDMNVQGVDVSAGFGLRYVNLEQVNSAQIISGGIATASLNSVRKYEGLGPSITLDAKKRLGNSPFSVFGEGGGAFLFGTKSLNRTVFGDQSPQPASPFLALEGADEVVGIGELRIGLEIARCFVNGSELTVRGSYQGSLWAEAGAPTLGFLGFEGFGITAEISR